MTETANFVTRQNSCSVLHMQVHSVETFCAGRLCVEGDLTVHARTEHEMSRNVGY
eukprot:COSAG01_NODE_58502_length_305_cov_1.621359_1_plen_54_part_10